METHWPLLPQLKPAHGSGSTSPPPCWSLSPGLRKESRPSWQMTVVDPSGAVVSRAVAPAQQAQPATGAVGSTEPFATTFIPVLATGTGRHNPAAPQVAKSHGSVD